MKKLWLILLIYGFFSCQNEIDAPLGVGDTFIKIIATDANQSATKLLQTDDNGYALLANASETGNNLNQWIKLIKTDAGGNKLWSKSFSGETENNQFVANDFIISSTGFLIIGESIKNDTSSLLLLTVDANGNETNKIIMPAEDDEYNYSGKSLAVNEEGNLMMLTVTSSITEATDKRAAISLLNENLDIISSYTTDLTGNVSLANDLLCENNNHFFIAGNHSNSGKTNMRFYEIDIESSLPPPSPEFTGNPHWFLNEVKLTNGRIIATGEKSGNADFEEEVISDRIIFLNTSKDGISQEKLIEINVNGTSTAATGYSVIPTPDGNFAILGAIGNEEGERELVLIKVNSNGDILVQNNEPFVRIYGGNGEKGATVISAKDGGFLLFGTTNFGGTEALLLIKTNSNGNL